MNTQNETNENVNQKKNKEPDGVLMGGLYQHPLCK